MKYIVLVHGWSVTNLNTYGGLPQRMAAEAVQRGMDLQLEHIFLSRYISFHDEVTLADIARALQAALEERPELTDFVCITHSTGGPVVRLWWDTYYADKPSPISHLIMLAPANFGSALAQLGKGKLSRLKSFFEGVEPGQGVLDWLELGSDAAWTLNSNWIQNGRKQFGKSKTFPFVLIGQSIDRALYDHVNSYTGELGSDGVVRTAAANLNANYLELKQDITLLPNQAVQVENTLTAKLINASQKVPLMVLRGKSHSGSKMGIMASVAPHTDDSDSSQTVEAIFACMNVATGMDYARLYTKFARETQAVQKTEYVEEETTLFLFKNTFIHDIYSQVIFRVRDHEGHAVIDYDLIFTAGPDDNPNHFPKDFVVDRQRNSHNLNTVTYYFNYTILKDVLQLGLRVLPRPDTGFVRYYPCHIKASEILFKLVMQPNATAMIDIILHRAVSREVFALEPTTPETLGLDFSGVDWEGIPVV
jgi:hypothetical protein